VTVGVVHYSLLCANDCALLCNSLFRYMLSFRGVQRTAVQMPMLRGSRGWLFFCFRSTRCGKSSIHVDLACNAPLVVV